MRHYGEYRYRFRNYCGNFGVNMWPDLTGYAHFEPCLCVGLDLAWYGGSKGNPDSQYDCVVGCLLEAGGGSSELNLVSVPLPNRDPEALETSTAIERLIGAYQGRFNRIVIGLDAPLQSTQIIVPPRQKAWRAADHIFSQSRMAIDRLHGGSSGWHPRLQPGAPLAPRVLHLLERLKRSQGLSPWTQDEAAADRLILEAFPAEVIWTAKRLGLYESQWSSSEIKRYKMKGRPRLEAWMVRDVVNTVLKPLGPLAHAPLLWSKMVDHLIDWLLEDRARVMGGDYRGGKLLDDAVDSVLCLLVAMSYASGGAHVWFDQAQPDDGHIMGPGTLTLQTASPK